MARGKALVAALRANPKVRDAPALAAWLGRRKAYRKLGVPDKMSSSLAGSPGGADAAKQFSKTPIAKAEREKRAKVAALKTKQSESKGKPKGLASRIGSERAASERREQARREREHNKPRMVGGFYIDDDDDFPETSYDKEVGSKDERERERYEAQLTRQLEKRERGAAMRAIMDQGGLKTNYNLREEYAGIPNTYKRKDGMSGDEMADHLARYHPELGIETERDLIDFLAA